jgi:hypothetical protein
MYELAQRSVNESHSKEIRYLQQQVNTDLNTLHFHGESFRIMERPRFLKKCENQKSIDNDWQSITVIVTL